MSKEGGLEEENKHEKTNILITVSAIVFVQF